jgi:two-component system LytT family response regulator
MTRSLLIDDDALARDYLRALLASHPEVEIVGETGTFKAARALLARNNYDVVFLDIGLVGGNGFDLVKDVLPGVPVIFVTGEDRHAARAFDVNAHDYIVKPIRPERLAESLRRLAERNVRPATFRSTTGGTTLRLEDTIHLNSGTRAHFARVADISLVQAHENYSLVQLSDGTQILVRRTLKAWAESLPETSFLRVHRATIANLARVIGYERSSPRTIALRLSGVPHPISVSRIATHEAKTRLHARFPEI